MSFPDRYPSLKEFWPAIRARNFVKQLRQKPGNYAHNMEILAVKAGVHPKQMWYVNPVTFAEREFNTYCARDSTALIKLLGKDTYYYFCDERNSPYSLSASWAYHKREPIPPHNPWEYEIGVIMRFIDRINALPVGSARVSVMGTLFSYLSHQEEFLRTQPTFCNMISEKVVEFKTNPYAEPIMDQLLSMEELLGRVVGT